MRYLPRLIAWAMFALLGVPAFAQGTSPLPGQVKVTTNIQVSSQGQSYVQLQLVNCPTQHPRVILNAVLSRTIVQTSLPPFAPDASGNVAGYVYPNDVLSCDGTVGHSAYSVTYVQNGVPTGTAETFIVMSGINPFDLTANTPVTNLPPPFVPGQDFHFRNLILDGALTADTVIANHFVLNPGALGSLNLWGTGTGAGLNIAPTIQVSTAVPDPTACNAAVEYGNMWEQTTTTSKFLSYCTATGWQQDIGGGGSGSAGVLSINNVTGFFQFNGNAVNCTQNTCTFTDTNGVNGGGVLNQVATYVDATHIASDPFLIDTAPNNSNGQLLYTGPGGSAFTTAKGGGYTLSTSNKNGRLLTPDSQINLTTELDQLAAQPSGSGQILLSAIDNFGNTNSANVNILAQENNTSLTNGQAGSSGNVLIRASNQNASATNAGNITMQASSAAPAGGFLTLNGNVVNIVANSSSGNSLNLQAPNISEVATGFLSLGGGSGIALTANPGSEVISNVDVHTATRFISDLLTPNFCLMADAEGKIVSTPCGSGTGGGTGGGTAPTVQEDLSLTNANTKLCFVGGTADNTYGCIGGGGIGLTPPAIVPPVEMFGNCVAQQAGTVPAVNGSQGCTTASPSLGGADANATAFFSMSATGGTTNDTEVLYPHGASKACTSCSYYQRDVYFRLADTQLGTTAPNTALYLSNLEMDTDHNISTSNGLYAFGWQCNRFNTGFWQYNNQTIGWRNTNIPCSLVSGHIYHTTLDMHRVPGQTSCTYTLPGSSPTTVALPCSYWDKFTLADVTAGTTATYDLQNPGGSQPAAILPVSSANWSNTITTQWQLDTKTMLPAQKTVGVQVDNDVVTASTSPITSQGSGTTATANTGNLASYNFDSATQIPSVSSGSISFDTTNAYTAPSAADFNAVNEFYTTAPWSVSPTTYSRFYFKINAATTASMKIASLYNGSTELWNLYFTDTSNNLSAFTVPTSTNTACLSNGLAGPMTVSAWHYIDIFWQQGTGTAGAFTVKVDGAPTDCVVTGVNTGAVGATNLRFGELTATGSPWDVEFDNVDVGNTGYLGAITFSSNTGGSNNSSYDPFGASSAALAAAKLYTNQVAVTQLTGDVTGNGPGAETVTVRGINGVPLSGLGTCLLKNTTSTGVPTCAVSGTDYAAPGGGGIQVNLGATQSGSGSTGTATFPGTVVPAVVGAGLDNTSGRQLDAGGMVGSVQFGLTAHTDSLGSDGQGTSPQFVHLVNTASGNITTFNCLSANYCVGGDNAADNAYRIFTWENPGDTNDPAGILQIGTNNARLGFMATAEQQAYQGELGAGSTWWGMSSSDKILAGNALITPSGTWTADTTFATANGLQSTTNGSTLPLTNIVSRTGVVYVWYLQYATSGGTFTVNIDGTPATNTWTGSTSITTQYDAHMPPAHVGLTVGIPTVARFVTTPGSHTITPTVTSLTGAGNIVTVIGFGFPRSFRYRPYNGPRVAMGGVPYQALDAQSALTTTFDVWNQQVAQQNVNDGLNTPFVNVRAALDYNCDYLSVSVGNCAATLAGGPPYHWNQSAALRVAALYEAALNLTQPQGSIFSSITLNGNQQMGNASVGTNIFFNAGGSQQMGLSSSGSFIYQNSANASPVWIVNNQHAGATGDLADFKWQSVIQNGFTLNGLPRPTRQSGTLISAATIAPSQAVTFMNGSATVTTITPPAGCTDSAKLATCIETFIPVSGSTWTFGTGGNIASAVSPTALLSITLLYDSITALWYPEASAGGTYTLPQATTSVLGGVKCDGTTTTCAAGVISAVGGGSYTLPTATTSVLGGVKVDGTSVTINGSGIISATPGADVMLSNSADVAATGFTTDTPLCALKIPAGTMSGTIDAALSRLDGTALITTAGTSTAGIVRLSLSSSATVVGTTLVASASASAGRPFSFAFHCSNRTSSSQLCYSTVTGNSTAALGGAATPTLSVASDMYLVFSATQTVSTDTQTCRMVQAEIH